MTIYEKVATILGQSVIEDTTLQLMLGLTPETKLTTSELIEFYHMIDNNPKFLDELEEAIVQENPEIFGKV